MYIKSGNQKHHQTTTLEIHPKFHDPPQFSRSTPSAPNCKWIWLAVEREKLGRLVPLEQPNKMNNGHEALNVGI